MSMFQDQTNYLLLQIQTPNNGIYTENLPLDQYQLVIANSLLDNLFSLTK